MRSVVVLHRCKIPPPEYYKSDFTSQEKGTLKHPFRMAGPSPVDLIKPWTRYKDKELSKYHTLVFRTDPHNLL